MATTSVVVKDDANAQSLEEFEMFIAGRIETNLDTSSPAAPLVYRRCSTSRLKRVRESEVYAAVLTRNDIAQSGNPLYSANCAPTHPPEFAVSGLRSLPRVAHEQKHLEHLKPVWNSKGSVKVGKNQVSGKPFTSKFRGVHRTIPTKRWEAQFRRAGKPTSLGCFDTEESAARAYDKMMVWCQLHNTNSRTGQATIKNGQRERPHPKANLTNYPSSMYQDDVPWLMSITQEELLLHLRKEGRAEAAATRRQHAADLAARIDLRPRVTRKKNDGDGGDGDGGDGDGGDGDGLLHEDGK